VNLISPAKLVSPAVNLISPAIGINLANLTNPHAAELCNPSSLRPTPPLRSVPIRMQRGVLP
jgi:hypothetical protein